MPQLLVPLHEFNACHQPAGSPQGGQFCSTDFAIGIVQASGNVLFRGFPALADFMQSQHAREWPNQLVLAATKFTYRKGHLRFDEEPTREEFIRAWDTLESRGYRVKSAGTLGRGSDTPEAYVKVLRETALREFNACHQPGGRPDGGQFCGTGHWTAGSSRVTASRRATTSDMHPATDMERRKLAIPPAYTNVMVADDPKAELRATALSPATGRTAYFYAKGYTARQQHAKWSRIVAVQKGMAQLEARLERDLARPTRDAYHTAMALRLILQTGMRNGHENDAGTFAASSLLLEHVTTNGNRVRFQFAGKGGKGHDLTVKDSLLAQYVEERRAMGGGELFPHDAADTLTYLKKVGRRELKVHDLRAWYATVYADHLVTEAVRQGLTPTTVKAQKRFRREVATVVGDRLGDTVATTLNTYIHPKVWSQIGWKG